MQFELLSLSEDYECKLFSAAHDHALASSICNGWIFCGVAQGFLGFFGWLLVEIVTREQGSQIRGEWRLVGGRKNMIKWNELSEEREYMRPSHCVVHANYYTPMSHPEAQQENQTPSFHVVVSLEIQIVHAIANNSSL